MGGAVDDCIPTPTARARKLDLPRFGARRLREVAREAESLRRQTLRRATVRRIHDLRLAYRRLRILLALFRPLVRTPRATLGNRLGQVDDWLGVVRDMDTFQHVVRTIKEPRVAALRGTALHRRRLLVIVLRTRLRKIGPMVVPEARVAPRVRPSALVALLLSRYLSQAAQVKAGSSDEKFHAARIALRRLRTAVDDLEALAPREVRRFLDRTKRAAQLLSLNQDLAVTRHQLEAFATDQAVPLTSAERFHAGRVAASLEARQPLIRQKARAQLHKRHRKAARRLSQALDSKQDT